MQGEAITIAAADGHTLGARRFQPPSGETLATIVIAPASATPQRFYRHFAAHLATCGFDTLTFDYRGIGESRPRSLRGYHATMRQWGEHDLDGVLAFVEAELRPRRQFLVGHSAGGQLVGLAPRAAALDGIYLAASSSGYYGLWPGWQRLALHAAFLAIPPLARVFGYLPYGALGGTDLPRDVAIEWSSWGRHPDYIRSAGASFEHVRAPVRALSFSDDLFAARAAVAELVGWYERSEREHIHHSPREVGMRAIGHFGFFRPEAKEALWPDAVQWLARLC
ncbi:MAG: alpha/beta fold hydrolase [Myxococcales bacterium]|nr:alpha/beta fold hydrolase [Myxococcales bacterium]